MQAWSLTKTDARILYLELKYECFCFIWPWIYTSIWRWLWSSLVSLNTMVILNWVGFLTSIAFSRNILLVLVSFFQSNRGSLWTLGQDPNWEWGLLWSLSMSYTWGLLLWGLHFQTLWQVLWEYKGQPPCLDRLRGYSFTSGKQYMMNAREVQA